MGRLIPLQSPPVSPSHWVLAGGQGRNSVGFPYPRITTNGFSCQPLTVFKLYQNRLVNRDDFTPAAVLRQNLKACMDSKHGPSTQDAVPGVSQATIGRILNKDEKENTRIDTVAKIARAYGLETWMLLVPGMDPENPPVLQPVTQAERALYAQLQSTVRDLAKIAK